MYEILAFVSTLLSCYLLVRAFKPEGISETILVFFPIASALIIGWGYLLSSVNRLGDIRYWSVLGSITAVASAAVFVALGSASQRTSHFSFLKTMKPRIPPAAAWFAWYKDNTSPYEKILLTPLVIITVTLGILNLSIVLFTAPHNFDSMTYHLARMAYYLQHNNLNYYPANYWAQVVHPKNSTLLLIYSYLVSGRNENMTQSVQFISYCVAVFSVYGIARRLGNTKPSAIFSALVAALLVEWLLLATTTQNDMILTAFFGTAIYSLFSFKESRQRKYLVMAALGIGLSIGTSAKSFLTLPSVILIACYILFSKRTVLKGLRNLGYLAAFTFISVALFALPAGYVENYRIFGNPIGPEQIRQHSFEGRSFEYVARSGAKNILRFGFDFLRLDGLPPINAVDQAQLLIDALPKGIVNSLGIDLETQEGALKPFSYQKNFALSPNEDWSSWGIFGFALIWIVVLLSAFGLAKNDGIRALSFASIVFLLVQAFGGMYDPHRGRYFAACAVFAVPTVAVIGRTSNNIIRTYVLCIILIGCISAVTTVLIQPNRALISMKYEDIHRISVFQKDRIAQLTANNQPYYSPIKTFDSLVPPDATVAVFLKEDAYEYPLFGERLTRRIIPINSFDKGFQGLPADADYLLYQLRYAEFDSSNLYPVWISMSRPYDYYLGEDWYLWRLR